MTPDKVRAFRESHFKSRLQMAVEFKTTERTIRAYESGENKSIPGIFVKAVELWLKVNEAIRVAEYSPKNRAILKVLKK